MLHCHACPLGRLCLGEPPHDVTQTRICPMTHHLQLARGEHLFHMRHAAEGYVYFIRSGHIKQYQLSPGGTQHVIDFLHDGAWLSVETIGHHDQHGCAVALTACEIDAMPYHKLAALLERQPHRAAAFSHMLSRAIVRQQQASSMLRVATACQRVALFLLQCSGPAIPGGDWAGAPLPMSRQDIGDYLGLTPSTVSRVLSDFRRRGWLVLQQRGAALLLRPALEQAATGTARAAPARAGVRTGRHNA